MRISDWSSDVCSSDLTLDFPSKYEGSGKSRDTLNEKSNLRYKMLAKQVSDMEKGTSKLVDKYMDSGSPDALQCVLNWYGSWADAHALLAPSVNYTGKAEIGRASCRERVCQYV